MTNKLKLIFAAALAAYFVNCGKPLPIEEMSTAKLEISRAESYKSSRFAPEELENAKKALFASHDYASDEKIPETKTEAEKAIVFAREAIAKALPLLTAETKENAEKAIEEADRSFAVQLAADDLNKAIELVKVGDEKSGEAAKTMEVYKTDKKLETQQAGVDQYEVALKNYRDAEEYAKRATTLAMSQKQQIIDSAVDIEDSISKAEKYGADTEKLTALKRSYNEAIEKVQEGNIKEGFENLDVVRKEANLLLAGSIKDYAEKRKEEAKTKIAASDAKLQEVQKNPKLSKKESVATSKTQLQAGKEALASAEDLFGNEQFENSIEQSDEAIRLAAIVLERMGTMNIATSRGVTGMGDEDQKGTVSSESGEDGVWKKYIVRKKKPADCLWRIAGYKQHYNNPALWRRIYNANKKKIKNPNRIYPRQVLIIPPPPGMKTKKEEPKEDEPKAQMEETSPAVSQPETVEPSHETPAMENDTSEPETSENSVAPENGQDSSQPAQPGTEEENTEEPN